jgi:cytochrome c oxidase subunit 2
VWLKDLFKTGASSVAGDIDVLFWLVTLNAVVFTLGIFAAITFFAVYYRQGSKVDRTRAPLHNGLVEVVWTTIPLLIALGIFVGATVVFFHTTRVPPNAMEVQVVGKQWMWKMQQPNGRWENNELHVPVGRPVVLTMTSEDVIHSFFVPAFRLKQDVVPGVFTKMWFTATKPGDYHLFCAEFCGTLHAGMVGRVIVMEPAEYDKWLNAGGQTETSAAIGAKLFTQHGCNGCHGAGSSVRAPKLEGIYNRPIPVQIPKAGVPLEQTPATTVVADLRYLHDAILLPEQEVAGGYRPIMPTYKNKLSEEDVFRLVAYIRSLGNKDQQEQQRNDHSNELTPEDYKARTGFVPENIQSLTGGGTGAAPRSGSAPAPRGGNAGSR